MRNKNNKTLGTIKPSFSPKEYSQDEIKDMIKRRIGNNALLSNPKVWHLGKIRIYTIDNARIIRVISTTKRIWIKKRDKDSMIVFLDPPQNEIVCYVKIPIYSLDCERKCVCCDKVISFSEYLNNKRYLDAEYEWKNFGRILCPNCKSVIFSYFKHSKYDEATMDTIYFETIKDKDFIKNLIEHLEKKKSIIIN